MSVQALEAPTRHATVEGQLHFLEPTGRRPRMTYIGPGTGEVTEIYTPRWVTIRNARSIDASLDVEGFQLTRRRSSIDFLNEAEIADIGRAEAAELVRDVTGAARAVVFDHTLRKRTPDAPRQPSIRVHVDYTAKSGPQRVRDLMGAEADALLKRRVAFVNVWRGVRHVVRDWPLALGDARSFSPEDLAPTDVVYAHRVGEIYGATHNLRQRWYYYPDLALDEAVLIKCYDSRRDVARFTPHTAFDNPLTPASAPSRESIEFRTIAFFD